MVGLGTNVLAVTFIFWEFLNASPVDVEDYMAKYGKLLGNRENSVKTLNGEIPEQSHENMWNMLKRASNQIAEEEIKNENQKIALQSLLKDLRISSVDQSQKTPVAETQAVHSDLFRRSESVIPGIQNQFLKYFQMMNLVSGKMGGFGKTHSSPIFSKRGFGNFGYNNLRNMMMSPGLYKKSKDAEATENSIAHVNSGSMADLLGSLNRQAKRHDIVSQKEENSVTDLEEKFKEKALMNAVDEAQKMKWAASMNGLFKRDGNSELGNVFKRSHEYFPLFKKSGQEIGDVSKRSHDYFPLFKKSGQEQYFPLFKKTVSGSYEPSDANGLDFKLHNMFANAPELAEFLDSNVDFNTVTSML